MTELSLTLVALAAVLALTRWRWGLFLCVMIGLLQDPLRKLVPGQPVYFVVLVGVVFGATWLGAMVARVPLQPNAMNGWKYHMGKPFGLFIALVLAQAAHSFLRYGSAVMTGIGLMVWLAPVFAVVVAYQFAARRGLQGLRSWMLFYCAAAMVSLMGVYLQYSGTEWAALGEVGPGLTIYDVGGILKAYSGFFRSSELAAWHTATIAGFAFMLFTSRRLSGTRLVAALGFMAVLVSLGLLTGRRKMLVEMAMFVAAYAVQVAWFQRGATRQALGAAVLGLLCWGAVVLVMDPDVTERRSDRSSMTMAEGETFKGYSARGSSVFMDIPNRVAQMGVRPISWAVDRFGWFGAGLGTGAQQGTGREEKRLVSSGSAEGGLGKITMELGVPGLLLVGWLAVAMVRYFRRVLVFTTRTSLPHARMAYGLAALLLAKGASFSVAAPVYSDLFVLLIVGWSMGFVLALPGMAARSVAARSAAEKPAGVFPAPRQPQRV